MVKYSLVTACLLALAGYASADNQCRFQLAGDSTMQIVDPAKNPDFGWGQVLSELASSSSQIFNFAKGGRSTKTFITENRWQNLLDNTSEGDWVLIQFGHNDASIQKPERYTAPVDFEANLRRMVHDVLLKNAKPVLITPVARRYFDNEGKLKDIHGIYPWLTRRVAAEMEIPLIDLFESSSQALLNLGPINSIAWYVHIGPGVHPCCPAGRMDDTHFTQDGARNVAKLVVDELTRKIPETKTCFDQ
jgi:lysophospholipase L1-like esterase